MLPRISTALLVLAVASLTSGQDVRITPSAPVQKKSLGDSFSFYCTVSGISEELNPNLKWFDMNGEEITEKAGIMYIEPAGEQTLKLLFTSVQYHDAGDYKCEGTVGGKVQVVSVNLFVFKEISFDGTPLDQHPIQGTDATILCVVSGQPTPEVSWRYRGQPLVGERYTVIQEGLSISDITTEDNGLYICNAEVREGGNFKRVKIRVTVSVTPVIESGPGIVEGVEKTEVVLDCKASGIPAPKYEFYKVGRGSPLVSNDRVFVDRDAGSLVFRRLHRDDGGEYRCTSINDAGSASVEGTLVVIVPPELVELKNRTRQEGKKDRLRCMMFGNPIPQMSFEKPGYLPYAIGDNEGGRIMLSLIQQGILELTFNKLEADDSSNYTCIGTNSGGTFRQNGTMLVRFKPRFAPDHDLEMYNWAGNTRNLTCEARGEPTPSIHWVHFGRRLENNQTYKIYEMGRNSVLQVTIRQVEEGWIYGRYKCVATNDLGEGNIDINMIRAVVPGEPLNIRLKLSDPNMVLLSVDPPADDGGVKILKYIVHYGEENLKLAVTDELLVDNLQPGTNYVFQILATNAVGHGKPAEFIYKTEIAREPSAVDITSNPLGLYPYEYTMEWSTPRTGGMPLTQYTFKYIMVSVKEGGTIVDEEIGTWKTQIFEEKLGSPSRSYKIRNLRPDRYYEVRVTARNGIGDSPDHAQFVMHTSKDPNAPPLVVTTKSIDTGAGRSEPQKTGGMGTGGVIGIVVVIFIIFLIIVDVSCYFMNGCGLLKCCCVRVCGRGKAGNAENELEAGESNPLKDEVAVVDEKAELKKEMKSDEEALMKAAPTDEADVKVAVPNDPVAGGDGPPPPDGAADPAAIPTKG